MSTNSFLPTHKLFSHGYKVLFKKVIILDGYTDEPAGLGVPPYINTYPRLIAGAIWVVDKTIHVKYWTIDTVRSNLNKFIQEATQSDMIVFIAGPEVPGKYIGGTPLRFNEVEKLCFLLRDKTKILVGPAARYGFGGGGGTIAVERIRLKKYFDELVIGDPEIYFYESAKYGLERADPYRMRETYDLANQAFIYGSRIIKQHPNYGWNLIVEIETFRGCPRYITGGCSFCIEPRYGKPLYRRPEDIVREIKQLYNFGARHYRLGKQPDILAYMAKDTGTKEFPEPNTDALRKLFLGIRNNAPGLRVLHIDNVNPGTIIHNKSKAIEAMKIIIKYHTPGDVAALGIESFDPRVVKMNNLKVTPEEAIEAIRIINQVGSHRGWNGLPHLLPGINLLYGLPGETKETYILNYEYLSRLLQENLLVRRINIRKVTVLENTPLWLKKNTVYKLLRKHQGLYTKYRLKIMNNIDKPMLKKILPPGTLMRYLYVEKQVGNHVIARMPGSYPIAVKIPYSLPLRKIIDARIKSIAAKSVLAEPV